MASAEKTKSIVICGGGIIGCATAYFITKLSTAKVIIIERGAIACHSSGKAGGFLAKNWNGGAVDGLARKSYELHKELANEFSEESIEYRTMTCIGAGRGLMQHPDKSWLDHINGCSEMGTEETVAQVHPYKLTKAFYDHAIATGRCTLIKDAVVGINLVNNQLQSIKTSTNGDISCDSCLLALGAWTSQASKWIPNGNIPSNTASSKYTSVVIDAEVDNTAVFLQSSNHVEVYPRPNGKVYACGCPENSTLPDDPLEIKPKDIHINTILKESGEISSVLANGKVSVRQACFLPGSADGNPVIGKVSAYEGIYVGYGHTCWGILNGPATGLGLAELIVNGESKSVDLSGFDPDRSRTGECAQQ